MDPVTKVDLTVSATLPKLFSQAIRLMDYLVVHVVKFILVGAFFSLVFRAVGPSVFFFLT